MFYKTIITASALALGLTTGFSEPLKTGRPDAYTRGIDPNRAVGTAVKMEEHPKWAKPGRPDALTRGIGGDGTNTYSDSGSGAVEKAASKGTTWRPDALTMGRARERNRG